MIEHMDIIIGSLVGALTSLTFEWMRRRAERKKLPSG
jgi:hypothetical protein